MKDDEQKLLSAVYQKDEKEHVKDVLHVAGFGMSDKRIVYILGKWVDKGWYDFGVNIDLGWLTEAGKQAAQNLLTHR